MSRENVELILRLFERAPDDPEALFSVIDEDAEWSVEESIAMPGAVSQRGPAAVREFFRTWVGAFGEWGFDVLEAIDAGDSVILHIRQWGTGRASGVRVEQAFWAVWTLRDGRVVRASTVVDGGAARRIAAEDAGAGPAGAPPAD